MSPRPAALHAEEKLGRAYDGRLLARLMRGYVFGHHWRLLAGALVCLPLAALLELVQPYLLKVAVDDHLTKGRLEGLLPVALVFLLAVVLLAVVRFWQTYAVMLLGQRVTHRLREDLFSRVQDLPQSFFDRTPVGRLLTRLTSDVEAIQEMFASGAVSVVGDFFLLAGIMGAMLWLNAGLALLTFAAIPILLAFTFWVRPHIRDAFRQVRIKLSEINVFLQEHLSGMAVVQLFRKEGETGRLFEGLSGEYRRRAHQAILYDVSLYALVEATESIMVALIIWHAGGRILEGMLTLGVLVAFLGYIQKFFSPLMDLSSKYTIMQSAMTALERIFGLLDEKADPALLGTGRGAPGGSAGRAERGPAIAFEGVGFSYGGEPEVLRGVSFRAGPGETVALVGATGAGKSTCLKLLCRLYEAGRGRITLDGVDIREIPAREVRRRVGMVLQDVFLFSGDIRRNIRLGDESIDDETVRRVAEEVGVQGMVRRFPDGFESSVLERGGNLSAGERQLLSLARAVARRPEVLLVDEATSHLDPATEYETQRVLASLYGKTTTLVIAHRLSTVKRADWIVVLHKGEVREIGAHADLLAQGGIYARLYDLQYRQQENGSGPSPDVGKGRSGPSVDGTPGKAP
ncbi:MAG: ABC transporter ATP-binding protein [Candidatus Tectomicrobia bacterium]|nr:ABC transporter ATP-binding protein [Candidatus Tectomicrobia bacterium]